MIIKDQQILRRTLIIQGASVKTQFWCIKSMFAIIIGYVIGFLISDVYKFDYIPLEISIQENSPNKKIVNDELTDIKISLKDQLYNNVKLLCWIMTYPENHKTRVAQVLKTWGKRCNKILFMSSEEDQELDIIGLPIAGEGRDYLWPKTKEAFKYIYDNYFDEYDWFLKADDDTYVVVENLRLLLYEYDPSTPIYFGYKFKAYVKQGYMSGGGGYVLSKEALERFIINALPNPDICGEEEDGPEDFEIGNCLQNVGVIAGDSRDIDKRGRFFTFPPEEHLLTEIIDLNFWYWQYMFYTNFEGLTCCSDNAISFHYITKNDMLILDYLIYNAKPYGIIMGNRKLPEHIIYIPGKIPKYN